MPSIFLSTKLDSYRAMRGASQGASITLLAGANEYIAHFACATAIAAVLGNRELEELCDGLYESCPRYRIPTEDMASALQKLSVRHSIALLDATSDRFVLVWKILSAKPEMQPASTNLDEY